MICVEVSIRKTSVSLNAFEQQLRFGQMLYFATQEGRNKDRHQMQHGRQCM